jgi:hypothetical protein
MALQYLPADAVFAGNRATLPLVLNYCDKEFGNTVAGDVVLS